MTVFQREVQKAFWRLLLCDVLLATVPVLSLAFLCFLIYGVVHEWKWAVCGTTYTLGGLVVLATAYGVYVWIGRTYAEARQYIEELFSGRCAGCSCLNGLSCLRFGQVQPFCKQNNKETTDETGQDSKRMSPGADASAEG